LGDTLAKIAGEKAGIIKPKMAKPEIFFIFIIMFI
jgi:folylpolyglutamate synthase/dihydropteroate synthase